MTVNQCRHCGSTKVIFNTRLEDKEENSTGCLTAFVGLEDPDASFLPGPIKATLRADICCGCGLVDIRVENQDKLWEQFISMPPQERP